MKANKWNRFWNRINFINRGDKNIEISEEKKNIHDLIAKIVIIFFVCLTLLAFAALIGFVIAQSAAAFHEYGFFNILFGNKWNPSGKPVSFGILSFITATFWVCLFSMLLAIPLGILSSLFICEFLPKKLKKISLTFIELLSGIPSVVFGAFGLMIIGPIFVQMGAPTKENMMTASFILALMSLPTIISLSVNAINGVSQSSRYASLALGISQTNTTFKIVFKGALIKIIGAVIFGFGRVIGETMAVIMIAGGSVASPDIQHGPLSFFFASVTTLAGIIGIEINETTSSMHTSALYCVGIVLFIIVTIINIAVLLIYKQGSRKHKKVRKSKDKKLKTLGLNNTQLTALIYDKTTNKHSLRASFDYIRLTSMFLAWFITMGLILWIVGDVILEGIFNIHPVPGGSVWNFSLTHLFTTQVDPVTGEGGYLSLLATTFLLVLVATSIAMPIGIMVALYLYEYTGTDNKIANSIRFILNTLASTPSILYGMFGLILFIDFLKMDFSIITAGLTLTVVVLPVIIKSIEDSLKSVPNEFREASLALGANKISTIIKVVIPNALSGIITSMILTMGRIIGESAPVYLTLGATLQFPDKGFLSSGQTLTTHILFLNKDSPLPNKINLMYETAFITVALIFLLNFLAKYFAKHISTTPGVKTKWTIELIKSKVNDRRLKKDEKKQKQQTVQAKQV